MMCGTQSSLPYLSSICNLLQKTVEEGKRRRFKKKQQHGIWENATFVEINAAHSKHTALKSIAI